MNIIREGKWIHVFLNGRLQWRDFVETMKDDGSRVALRLLHARPKQDPNGYVYADDVEIYKDKFLYPPKSAEHKEFIDNWTWTSKKGYVPVKKKGIVIGGRGVRLKEIAELVGDDSLLKYDIPTKTATCYTNLVIDGGAELLIENETLKIHSSRDGEHEIALLYGAAVRVKNSTVTSDGKHYYCWRLSGTTHHGFDLSFLRPRKTISGFNYASRASVIIENSVVNNAAYMFIDSPHELRITDSKITNLNAVDIGDYTGSRGRVRARKEFVKGAKSFWLFLKNYSIFDFEMSNVTFTGKKSPIDIVFMVNEAREKLNIYNVDLRNENLVVRKSREMRSFWNESKPPKLYYMSVMGFVNCKFRDILVPTDKAHAVPKYYLDVKVVDAKGRPVRNATITVANEVDDANYPSEKIIHELATHCLRGQPRNYKNYNYYHLNLYSPLRSTTTGPDGHTPLPKDKRNTIILPDFVQDKDGKKEFTYTITIEKDGLKKIITGVNPGPEWYRPDPNKPTYTVTAILGSKPVMESEADLKKKSLAVSVK